MELYIQRNQRDKGIIFRKTIFMIDVRLDLSADELRLMKKHKIFKEVIYRRKADKRHTNLMFLVAKTAGNPVSAFFLVLFRFIAKMLSARCSYKSLYKGQYLACADIFELSETEISFHKACDRAINYLDAIRRYDGRGDLYKFESKVEIKKANVPEFLPNQESKQMIEKVEAPVVAEHSPPLPKAELPPSHSKALKAVRDLSKSKKTTPVVKAII